MITLSKHNANEVLDYISSEVEGLLFEEWTEQGWGKPPSKLMPLAAIWCTDSPILEIDGLKKCRFAPGERCRVENSKLTSGASNAVVVNVLGSIDSSLLYMTVRDDEGRYHLIDLSAGIELND